MFVYEHQARAALSRCGLDAGRLVIGRTAGQDTLTLQIAEPLGAQQEANLVRIVREEIKPRAEVEIVSEVDPQSPLLVDAREIWQA